MSLLRSDRSGCASARTFLLPSFLGLLLTATTQAGIVTLVSQTRFVDVNTSGVTGFTTSSDQRMDAPDFNPFNQSVSLSIVPPVAFANETVSQNSTITLDPAGNALTINATGNLFSGVSSSGLHGTDHFDVTFSITQPEPFSLTYNAREGDPRSPSSEKFVAGSFTGPSAPGALTVDPITGNFFDTVTFNGTLQPGTYTLSTEVNTIGDGSFTTNLTVGTAVPLPRALCAALVMLPLLMLGMRARGVRRHTF
jgi:hypothetical protein